MNRARIDFRSEGVHFFTKISRQFVAHDLADVRAVITAAEAAAAGGATVVGYIAYDAAPAFDSALASRELDLPLAWFGVCGETAPIERSAASLSPLVPAISASTYRRHMADIHQRIKDGETYQVNYSFGMHGTLTGSPMALFQDLCPTTQLGYFACIETEDWSLISLSPELFFKREGTTLTCRPMKGTRPRGLSTSQDDALAHELASSEKDRAENVMIVDLLRNDLGRIADFGSVEPTALFEVERHPTVLQMTSTVSAKISEATTLWDCLQALFPCGSVTGTPKVQTMGLIDQLEEAPRGAYCGAIGCLLPDGRSLFNVAIRTLQVAADGRAHYRVGSGVIADSATQLEYAECLLKAQIMQRPQPRFSLLETMISLPGEGIWLLDRHLARLADSASYFGFALDLPALRERLRHRQDQEPTRLRLTCDPQGRVELTASAVSTPRSQTLHCLTGEPWRLKVVPDSVHSQDLFLRHKTTHRLAYDTARQSAPAADDVILVNERGECTETSIGNLAVLLRGQWLTPPIDCGLLAGTLRSELLASGELVEAPITPQDLPRSDALAILNSVRGVIPAIASA